MHRRGHVPAVPPAPTSTPTRHRRLRQRGRFVADHPRRREFGAAASTPTSSPITPATPSCSGRATGTTSGVHPIWSVPLPRTSSTAARPAAQQTTSPGRAPSSRSRHGRQPVVRRRAARPRSRSRTTTTSSTPAATRARRPTRIGWASCPSARVAACDEMSTTGSLARHVPGHVGTRAARTCIPPGAHPGQLVMAFAAWQGTDHRLPRAAASDPCTWPTAFTIASPARSALAGAGDQHRAAPTARPARHRPPPARLLAGRLRRGHLHLRLGPVLRLHRVHQAQPAGRRHGGDTRRRGLLARGAATAASSPTATRASTDRPAASG